GDDREVRRLVSRGCRPARRARGARRDRASSCGRSQDRARDRLDGLRGSPGRRRRRDRSCARDRARGRRGGELHRQAARAVLRPPQGHARGGVGDPRRHRPRAQLLLFRQLQRFADARAGRHRDRGESRRTPTSSRSQERLADHAVGVSYAGFEMKVMMKGLALVVVCSLVAIANAETKTEKTAKLALSVPDGWKLDVKDLGIRGESKDKEVAVLAWPVDSADADAIQKKIEGEIYSAVASLK